MTTETSNARGEAYGYEHDGKFWPAAEATPWAIRHATPLYDAPPPAAARGDVRGLDLPLIACMLGDLGSNDASTYPAEVVAEQIRAIEALAAEGVQAGEVGDVPMTPERAAFFLRRFKADEKTLGPHEQQALDFAIASLSQQPEARGVVRHDLCDCPNGRAEHSPSCAALTGERNG